MGPETRVRKTFLSCFCALAAVQWAQAAKFVLGYSKPTQVSPCPTPTCLRRDVRGRIFALLKGLDSCHCFFRVITGTGSPDTCWAPFGLTPCAKPSSALEVSMWGPSCHPFCHQWAHKPGQLPAHFCAAFDQFCWAQVAMKWPFWRQVTPDI